MRQSLEKIKKVLKMLIFWKLVVNYFNLMPQLKKEL